MKYLISVGSHTSGDGTVTDHPFTDVQSDDGYGSSTSLAYYADHAWGMLFYHGYVDHVGKGYISCA
jgi:hypothetical protein